MDFRIATWLVLCICITSGSCVVIRNPAFRIEWQEALGLKTSLRLSPVIMLPGDGGSQLQARLNKPSVPHYFCVQKTADWFDLWLNVELLLPYVIDCWVDNMRMVYNNETGKTENAPGVEVQVSGFGNSNSVEYLDASHLSISKYFLDIANLLVSHGYKRDVSLRGAPYDFRRTPNELPEYFTDLKKLIEDTYEMNNQTAVTFVAHSMGNLFGLYFLQQQTTEWKGKYMQGFIALGAPWAGAAKAIKAFATGDNLDVALISAFRVRAEQRTNPSLTFIMPNAESKVWTHKRIFVSTPAKNYSLANMEEFFVDLGYPEGWEMYQRTANILNLKPPGVPMYCMYGVGVNTPETMVYGPGKFPDKNPNVVFGDGDGTVNRESLEYCDNWNDPEDNDPMTSATLFPFQGVTHMTVLSDKAVLAEIGKLLPALAN
ncbi:Group XV phospholipase A2 [Hypsibius exemplaris]|uniref:Group XV phospholipase A2 n=1 Tax=Hypsibius exemplaris TaxID=2072580 RepID=A0A1W0WXN2_HYPEX|nr:Group XV phospholipase A2 [Hypsibius exemplaris]